MKIVSGIVLTLLGLLVLYVASYFAIKITKPSFCLHKGEVSSAYRVIYLPLRRLDAKPPEHLKPVGNKAKVVFDGCNGYGDKLFFKYNNKIYSLYVLTGEVSQKVLSLEKGDEANIYIHYFLVTDSSFHNEMYPMVSDIEKVSQ